MAIDYSPELGLATAYKLRRSNCSLSLVEHAIQLIIRTTNNQHSCLGTRISFVVTLELPSGDVNFHYRMFLFRLCLSSRFKRAERIVNFFPPYLSPFLCPQAKKKKTPFLVAFTFLCACVTVLAVIRHLCIHYGGIVIFLRFRFHNPLDSRKKVAYSVRTNARTRRPLRKYYILTVFSPVTLLTAIRREDECLQTRVSFVDVRKR